MNKKDILKKIKEIDSAITYLSNLASELKALTDVSTPVLKRRSKARMEMRKMVNSKMRMKSTTKLGAIHSNKKAADPVANNSYRDDVRELVRRWRIIFAGFIYSPV